MDTRDENINSIQEPAATAVEDGPDAYTTTTESGSHPEDIPEVCGPNAASLTIRRSDSVLVWLDANVNVGDLMNLSDLTELLSIRYPEDTNQNTLDGRAPNANSSNIRLIDSVPIWLDPGQNTQDTLDLSNPSYFLGLISSEGCERVPTNISNRDVVLFERREDMVIFGLLNSSDTNSSTSNARNSFNKTSEDGDENSVDKWETASENSDIISESSSGLSTDDQWETASDSTDISTNSDMNSLRPLLDDSVDDYSDTEAESECSDSSEYSDELLEDSVEPDDDVSNARSF